MSAARFELGWYNGWSPDERRATIAVQRDAVASGALARPTTCSICRAYTTRDNPVWLHDEDYADPLAAYPVCRTCHRILHQRFGEPEPWRELVRQHHRPRAWFTLLSCDPDTMTRPYRETYPDGLPRPEA